jgi:hypothetical protein
VLLLLRVLLLVHVLRLKVQMLLLRQVLEVQGRGCGGLQGLGLQLGCWLGLLGKLNALQQGGLHLALCHLEWVQASESWKDRTPSL